VNGGPIRQIASGIRIDLTVFPRSPRNQIDGIRDGRLVVRVTAPPVDGAANEAIIKLFVRRLGVPRSAITLRSGLSSRRKTLEISGALAAPMVYELLTAPD
jgi:uncharacterized protein (TIGR00251 family)